NRLFLRRYTNIIQLSTALMCTLHQINSDGSIGLPFGHAVETYVLSLPIATVNGMTKSTNHLDDTLELTEKGRMQRDCGGFGSCVPNCSNYEMKNNLKN
ncbi:4290_t:CDS:2, partial [Cetraspora pellucida]